MVRFAFAFVAALLVPVAVHAQAKEPAKDWSGQRIMVKQPGVKIGHTDDKGNQIYVAELTGMAYTVLAERDGWLKVAHRNVDGWFDKSQAMLIDDAVVFWKGRVAQDPKDAGAFAYYGWALRESGQPKEAIKAYDQAIAVGPTPDWLNNRGLIHLELKDHEKAIADFSEAIRTAPKFVLALENRAGIHSERKEWDKALADLDAIVKVDPKHADAYRKRAETLVAKSDLKKALTDLDVAIQLEPKHLPSRLYRGTVRLDLGQFQAAADDFTAALEIQPNEANARVQRAHALAGLKKFKEAIEDLDVAIRVQPKTAGPRAARGFIRFQAKEYEPAIDDFQAAMKLDALDPAAPNGYAWLLATAGEEKFRDGKKAVELAKQACELTKWKEAGCIDTLAAAHAEAGSFDDAVRFQTQAIEVGAFEGEELAEARRRLDLFKKKMPYRQP